ncbi:tRNA (adenosine(37)-N6)-dimethylallyltransferase MiaA [Arsenicibacter rosenii]|uniref:tRNA dimethylallyltransferase n=1 Tax=Arsenicibacter rosenii TaxID=1750698 RepID=A0A1S2VIM7_9BACT|nr:tRNA (adenosine(37)-N6)-dimethylallyltransferase MiaA [Arsenicibacter rosenii]OIN58604.1 tRNA (adenosine(37)-N6)-dimethylallyltransferase MiaA [Arsenicibacter rosenii]
MADTDLLVILGPTASGKTKLAVQVARQLQGEIISVDSRQVYRGMDIGTGKDLDEYTVDGEPVPYHLINVVDAGEDYHIYRFQQDVQQALDDIRQRGKRPILCGGTGLYLEAILNRHAFTAIPIDQALRDSLSLLSDDALLARFHQSSSAYSAVADTSTRKRLIRAIEINQYLTRHPDTPLLNQKPEPAETPAVFGIDLPVDVRRARITRRLHERLQSGMIEEVEQLLASGIPAGKLIFYGLEYKFITQYLAGELDYETMSVRLETAIHQFAKRQMTFFRKMERDGLRIQWLDGLLPLSELVRSITSAA